MTILTRGAPVAALMALAFAAPVAAQSANTASFTIGGVSYEAYSTVVGHTSTGTIASGGNPIYLGTADRYRGTVGLRMVYEGGQATVCSGSLLSDRRSILTAGHCVSDGAGTANPLSTTVFFYDGNGTDPSVYAAGAAGVTTRQVGAYHVNSGYTGNVVDQNDIAVLTMTDLAPAFANSYELFTDDLTGRGFNVAGYGLRSTTGGALGTTNEAGQNTAGTGRLRQGDNRYDYRLGDADFGGFFGRCTPEVNACQPGTNFYGTNAQVDYVWITDFDNPNGQNDGACGFALLAGVAESPKFCSGSVGATEVMTAGGDSGGPQFVNGRIASVTSFGSTRGGRDFRPGNQSSWGELGGYVPVSIHTDFIANAMLAAVPEPSSWAMMIGGFGLVGFSLRSRRRAVRFA